MSEVSIMLLDQKTDTASGLIKAGLLYDQINIDPSKQWFYLNREGDIDIPLLPDDHLIIHGGETIFADDANADIDKNPNVRKPVCFELNGKRLETGKAKLTGHELRKLDTELDPSQLFADLSGQADARIQDDWTLVIQEKDRYFTIPASDDDTVDVEACAKHGCKPPKGQKNYKIKIDGEKYKVDKPTLTGAAILALSEGKNPDEWTLNQKFCEGRRKAIEADQEVDLSQPGVERFETAPRQAQQGISAK